MKLGPHQVGRIHPLPLFAELLLLFPNAGATRGCSTSAPAGAGAQRPQGQQEQDGVWVSAPSGGKERKALLEPLSSGL